MIQQTSTLTRDKRREETVEGVPVRPDGLKLLGPLETRVANLEAAVSQAAVLKIASLRA